MLCIYADYKSDESYTPSKISVRVGNNFHNLQEIRVKLCVYISIKWIINKNNLVYKFHPEVSKPLRPSSSSSSPLQQLEMVEPSGWIHISLMNPVRINIFPVFKCCILPKQDSVTSCSVVSVCISDCLWSTGCNRVYHLYKRVDVNTDTQPQWLKDGERHLFPLFALFPIMAKVRELQITTTTTD